MVKNFLFTAFVLVTTTLSAHAQQAASIPDTGNEPIKWQAKIEETKQLQGQGGIPFLVWAKDVVLVETTSYLNYVDIQGRFKEKISQATLNSKQMPVKEDGAFDIHFGFPTESKFFTITAVDAKNKVYRMQYKITPVDHQEVILDKIPTHRWRFSAGAGATLLSFRQQNVTPFNEYALTVKGSATFRLVPDKFDLGISSFFNALPIGSQSDKGYKIQYLGVNGRIGWNVLGSPSPLRININAGLYYNTSISTVGFANMYGPQLYPEFIYIFDNGNSLLLYAKYSPALSQTQIISFTANREVAIGTHYSFPISFSNRMSIGVDISQLSLSVVTPKSDWASTNTYSLSAGISF